ncbi:hypothetical protein GCM10023116_03660 [Kistimonas scapharcae]|uniref:Uncharacterized protein n=1 Tax=Kistimonas scapharcae TaxID=1036133 RepID=A0ABP8UWW4_9GAMM
MTRFFVRMANIYGHLWTSRFRSEDQATVARNEWLLAFERNGLSAECIGRALDHCEDRVAKPPTLPEFIALAGGGHRIPSHEPFRVPKRENVTRSLRERRMRTGQEALSSVRQLLDTTDTEKPATGESPCEASTKSP